MAHWPLLRMGLCSCPKLAGMLDSQRAWRSLSAIGRLLARGSFVYVCFIFVNGCRSLREFLVLIVEIFNSLPVGES